MAHHLAQVNLAYMRAPQDDPLLAGHIPTPSEAKNRLRLLGAKGPHPQAFTFKQAFTPAGQPTER